MTGFKKLLFLPLLFINFNLCAEISGNMDHQEIGDVVFRNLDFKFGTLTEDHSAIYVGQTNKTGVPSEPFSHEVIQMAGIQPWGISGLTVTKVKGIGFDNLGDFQRSHPKYYGAFMYKDNPEATKNIKHASYREHLANMISNQKVIKHIAATIIK